MRKSIAFLLALIMCISLVACEGKKTSPKERLQEEVKNYISENYRITVGSDVSEAVNVDIASIVDVQEGEKWAVMGTYTVKLGKEVMSAKFALTATYDEKNDKFVYSNEKFDQFK